MHTVDTLSSEVTTYHSACIAFMKLLSSDSVIDHIDTIAIAVLCFPFQQSEASLASHKMAKHSVDWEPEYYSIVWSGSQTTIA